jgi:hypothetical protein
VQDTLDALAGEVPVALTVVPTQDIPAAPTEYDTPEASLNRQLLSLMPFVVVSLQLSADACTLYERILTVLSFAYLRFLSVYGHVHLRSFLTHIHPIPVYSLPSQPRRSAHRASRSSTLHVSLFP